MKIQQHKPAFIVLLFLFLIACSTKKDTLLSRNYHALTARDNIIYNGQMAFDKGLLSLENVGKDNFWDILPVEKMELKKETNVDEKPKESDFTVAEAKATKAIQKHSMNIDGQERNYQIDEAYFLLGKARYFDQRFFPAIEAFNYILYKYPTSSIINEAKIWREKTNMQLGNDVQVQKNLKKLLKGFKIPKQIIADANAILAASFLNLEQKDSAIARLKIAEENTKKNYEKARYRFILGQLYQELGIKDTALTYFNAIIKMNRKANREFLMRAQGKRIRLFDFEKGDTIAFQKTYKKLIKDRENRPFKDVLYHEMGVFNDSRHNQKLAREFYNKSIKTDSQDDYLAASNYRNIGNQYFKNHEFANAATYYDSTLIKLNVKSREHIHFKKLRKDLEEVIAYEFVANSNDSILNVVALNDNAKISFYEKHIEKLKKAEEEKKKLEEKQNELQKIKDRNNNYNPDDPSSMDRMVPAIKEKKNITRPVMPGFAQKNSANVFYFYNPSTVAYGKMEFRKKFGDKTAVGNWRTTIKTEEVEVEEVEKPKEETENKDKKEVAGEKPEYNTDFYIKKLPKSQIEIDSITKERNFAYYQLGLIYKEKLKENKLASTKLEQFLEKNPDEKLILPAMYNLYKIYQIIDKEKAEVMKSKISSQYPNSRYAQIINNKNQNGLSDSEAVDIEYNKWYKLFQEEQFFEILKNIDNKIIDYYGEDIVPKFELLKANTVGKLRGLLAYRKSLQFVADNYETTEEGKNALDLLKTQIPILEKMNFANTASKKWKILFKIDIQDKITPEIIEEKFKKMAAREDITWLETSLDIYTEKANFFVIQTMNTQAYANYLATLLREDVQFNLKEKAIVISNENYKIVQIKKNIDEFLEQKNAVLKPNQAVAEPNLINENPKTVPETQPIKANSIIPPGSNSDVNDNDSGDKLPDSKE